MSAHYDVKQVILVRRDLRTSEGHKVRTGKLMVQAAHASMAWLTKRVVKAIYQDETAGNLAGWFFNPAEQAWMRGSFAKIVLGVDSEAEMLALVDKARKLDVTAEVITDLGHTEFGGVPTVTCAGIGPATAKVLDEITGHLKPY